MFGGHLTVPEPDTYSSFLFPLATAMASHFRKIRTFADFSRFLAP